MSQNVRFCHRCGAPIDPVLERCRHCDDEYLLQDESDMIFDEDMDDL